MASLADVENCYRYILGRGMNADEIEGARSGAPDLQQLDLRDLRRSFLQSPEFHHQHLETLFENLVPRSTVVAYDSELGFRIYLDLRQLHLSFGILNGAYERHEIDVLRRIMPDGGTFIDVGANVGYYALAIAARPDFCGHVHAFEPLPALFSLLQRSIAENGLQDCITARCMALADGAGEVPLSDATASINAGSTRLALGTDVQGARCRAVVDTLDSAAAHLSPDVIKADIEGAEGLFLRGGVLTIRKHRPTLLLEINSELLALVSRTKPAEIQSRLAQAGYDIWQIGDHGLSHVAAESDLGAAVPAAGVTNILCVHRDRFPEVRLRLAGVIA